MCCLELSSRRQYCREWIINNLLRENIQKGIKLFIKTNQLFITSRMLLQFSLTVPQNITCKLPTRTLPYATSGTVSNTINVIFNAKFWLKKQITFRHETEILRTHHGSQSCCGDGAWPLFTNTVPYHMLSRAEHFCSLSPNAHASAVHIKEKQVHARQI